MKILFVSEYYPPKIMGGGEINLEVLATALTERGIGVSVLTSYFPGLEETEMKKGLTILRNLKTGNNPSSFIQNIKRSLFFSQSIVREVKKILNKQEIDAIHFIGTSIIAAKALKKLRVPLFATIESYPTLCPKGDRIFRGKKECKKECSFTNFLSCQASSRDIGKMKNKWYLKYNFPVLLYIYHYYDRLHKSLPHCNLIAISEYVQRLLEQQGNDSIVIPNALPINKFKINKFKFDKEKKSKYPKIIYFGSLIRSKGPQVLLEAIEGLNVKCELYGEGVLQKELEQKIQQRKLSAKIFAPVPYDEIPSLYAQADIVVFPSTWPEPFGRIAIEAMAAGKPIVGSAIGGIKETITKETGILVDPGNSQQLREAIMMLIHNPSLRNTMKKAGREIAEKKYTEDKVIERLVAVYKTKINSSFSNLNRP